MAGFLRRKTKHSDAPPTRQRVSITPSSPQPIGTPFFSRLAQQQTVKDNNANAGEARAVSSPMQLSGGVRRESTTGGGTEQRRHTGPSSFTAPDDRPRQSVDKPPPPPRDARRISSRGHAPAAVRNLTSLLISDDKPLPAPAQGGRKLSPRASFQPPPQTASPTITNLHDDEFDDAVTPRVSVCIDKAQDSHASPNSTGRPASSGFRSSTTPVRPSSLSNSVVAANSMSMAPPLATRVFGHTFPHTTAPAMPDHYAQENYLPHPPPHPQTYTTTPIIRGKPLIFAAMAAADSEADPHFTDYHQPLTPIVSHFQSNNHDAVFQDQNYPSPRPSSSSFSNGHKHRMSQGSQLTLSPPASHLNPPMYYNSLPPTAPAQDPLSRSNTVRTSRMGATLPLLNPLFNGSAKSIHRQSLPHPAPTSSQSAPRHRKLSKARQHSDVSMMLPNGSASSIISIDSMHSSTHGHGGKVHMHNGHRILAAKPSLLHLPLAAGVPASLAIPSLPPTYEQLATQVDEETIRNAGIPLDDDPFAKVEGVRMLSPIAGSGADPGPPAPAASQEGTVRRPKSMRGDPSAAEKTLSVEGVEKAEPVVEDVVANVSVSPNKGGLDGKEERRRERRERRAREKEQKEKEKQAAAAARERAEPGSSSGHTAEDIESEPEPIVGEELDALTGMDKKSFPLNRLLENPQLLANLLSYFSFYDWCVLSSVTRAIRIMLVQTQLLREEVFERYLKTVGYSRWTWEGKEPLPLSLQDLADYMRGVSTPSHEYARVARMYVHSLSVHPNIRDPSLEHTVRSFTASARAYTRVVLRLRAQAEKEASVASSNLMSRVTSIPPSASIRNGVTNGYVNGYSNGYASRPVSRPSSRAPSPTMSNYSHSQAHGYTNNTMQSNASQTSLGFRSPLFRLRRAPLLRVFVPSPEGDWLSDRSVLECEAECKRAGIMHLMRMGDVVWDIAVGDEGNVGRLVYDGKYLVDLDYTFNPIGDLPKYIPTLAFPPSYFHRVIRTGAVSSNPVVHIDIGPWGEEIAANLQLLQDRVKSETPQGVYHNLVRWVHRSSFTIRPPARVMQRGPSINGRGQPHVPRIPIPETENLFIDSGWYGTIVVETEGTNEALADLQDRCGPRAFPPRPRPLTPAQARAQSDVRKVFRILREKSRPGEIWIKAVGVKERLL